MFFTKPIYGEHIQIKGSNSVKTDFAPFWKGLL